MKVKIGPYLNWWGPYQIAGLLKYVGVNEDTCRAIGKKLADTKFNDLCEWVYAKRKRTIKVKIHPYDVWSMDHTLAHIVLPMLKRLREVKHGAPGSMKGFQQSSGYNYNQKCFDFYTETDDLADQAGFDEWDELMGKMIWSFEQLIDDDWEEQFFVNGYDRAGYEAHNARIEEGLVLFGKHYRSLWD